MDKQIEAHEMVLVFLLIIAVFIVGGIFGAHSQKEANENQPNTEVIQPAGETQASIYPFTYRGHNCLMSSRGNIWCFDTLPTNP